MPRRDHDAIDAELLMRLANRTDITGNMRANFIRDAYLNVALMFEHVQLQKIGFEGLAQGSDNFNLYNITDLWFPRALRNETNGYMMRADSLERVQRAQTKPTAPPYTYHWWGQMFMLEAFADTTKEIILWYLRKPTDFAGSQTSELDETFDPFILMEAARIGFETVRDFAEAQTQLQLFMAEAARKKLPVNKAKLNDYRQGWKVRFK